MKTPKINYKLLTIASLLLTAQVQAAPVDPQDIDLVSLNAPLHQVEQKSLHFSQAINKNQQLSFAAKSFSTTSDEYWQEVTGAQLMRGVALDISQPGALIRLSGKKSTEPSAPESLSIDPEKIQLSKGQQKLSNAFKQKISQQQFATANIFPNSSAVQLNKEVGRGKFNLKVNQSLNSKEHYLINVKEKGAEHLLTLSIPSQTLLANQVLEVNVAMNSAKGALQTDKQLTYIKTPMGKIFPVKTVSQNGHMSIQLPDTMATGDRGALYELHVASQAHDQALTVHRNAKVAFAIAQPTAKMTGKVSIENSQALVEVEVASEGRYEISALVSGINQRGRTEQVMLSRSAHYLQPGEQNVSLMFDRQLLTQLEVSPPYNISQLRLVDQSRMALLQQQ